MKINDFFFSYKNILLNRLEKKKYFSFFRKIFNLIYKQAVNSLKKRTNLDKLNKNKHYYNYNIDKLFKKFNCDKGSEIIINNKKIKTHKYSVFYEKHLKYFKYKKINILELGSHEGKGVASFYYFFPNANFYAANINPFQLRYSSTRIRELFVDVSSANIMNNLINHTNVKFDIIIDDASHNVRDILLALPIFFKKLKKGGIYIIEDIDQWKVFNGLNPTNEKLTPLMILKLIKENKEFKSNLISKNNITYLKKNISKFYFEKGKMFYGRHNISDIVFLKKNDDI